MWFSFSFGGRLGIRVALMNGHKTFLPKVMVEEGQVLISLEEWKPLLQESCTEHIDSQQLSCLWQICLTLIVALNKLIFFNIVLNTLDFCKVEAGASILPD